MPAGLTPATPKQVPLSQTAQPSTSRLASGSAQNPRITLLLDLSAEMIWRVAQFPTFRKITLGGAPNKRLRCRTSESFETIHKEAVRACSQMTESGVWLRPRIPTCDEPGYRSRISGRTRTGRFSSRRSFTRRQKAFARGRLRKQGTPGCHARSILGSQRSFPQPSSLPPDTPKRLGP